MGSAIHRGLEGIDVVGGSAGDNLAFANTWIIHNGQLYTKAAVLVLVRTHFRFKVFHHDNFEPTALKLVAVSYTHLDVYKRQPLMRGSKLLM